MKKPPTRKEKPTPQDGQFAAPISEPKFSMPPLSPIDAGLDQLAKAARNGDTKAVKRLREIQKRCGELLDRLPSKLTKKSPKIESGPNALAVRLLSAVHEIRKGACQGGGGPLEIEIKKLEPLSRDTSLAWFGCAWKFAKATSDRRIKFLVFEIGRSEWEKLVASNREKMEFIRHRIQTRQPGLKRGLDWRGHGDAKKVDAILAMIERRSADYARRQTKKAFRGLVKSIFSK